MTTTDPSETSTYLYETTVDLHIGGSVKHQQRALCVQYEDNAAKVTVTHMGETGLGTQLNINIPAAEVPAMAKALYAAAGLPDPLAEIGAIHNGCPNTQDDITCPWCRIAELEAAIEKARRVANALAGGGLIMAALDSEVTV